MTLLPSGKQSLPVFVCPFPLVRLICVRRHTQRQALVCVVVTLAASGLACCGQRHPASAALSGAPVPVATMPSATPTPTLGRILRIASEIKPPELIWHVEPDWHALLPDHWGKGSWLFQAIIDESGSVREVIVLGEPVFSPRRPEITPQLRSTLSQWRYRPATLNGKPTAVYLAITVQPHFRDR